MPDATGTAFDPDRNDAVGHGYAGNPFLARESQAEYEPLGHLIAKDRAAGRANNAKALRRIALEVMSEPRLHDPNVRYCRAVVKAISDRLYKSGSITVDDVDSLSQAFDLGVEHAARSVAAAWLRERGSLALVDDPDWHEELEAAIGAETGGAT
jgi:hypothetical protein